MPPDIQWYPGHIAKYERKLSELLKLVDVVIEVLDSRIPQASVNARLESKIRHKPTLIILNKSDLGDPAQNKRWRKLLTTGGIQKAMLYDAKNAQGKNQLLQHVLALGEAAMQKMQARGRKRRPIRVLVAGMPNVGKSTLINSVVGRKKTRTGHRAGVTRDTQWVRIHPEIELLDSPGVIPPQLENETVGPLLATVSSIGDAAFDDEEVARYLLEVIDPLYPGLLQKCFKLSPEVAISIENIAFARNYKLSGEKPDVLRMSQALLTDFRHGRLGRLTLEHAPGLDETSATPLTETESDFLDDDTDPQDDQNNEQLNDQQTNAETQQAQ